MKEIRITVKGGQDEFNVNSAINNHETGSNSSNNVSIPLQFPRMVFRNSYTPSSAVVPPVNNV